MDGKHGGEGPVADEEGVAVMGGKFRVGARDYAGGATGSDVDHRTHGVGEIFPPLLGGRSPTAFTSGNAVIDTGGAVPWGSDVPFHVGIVDEEFAVAVQGKVDRVAVAHVQDFTFLAVRADLENPTAGSLPISIVPVGVILQEVVVLPVIPDAGLLVFRGLSHVSRYDVEAFAVRRDHDGVRSVFAAPIHRGNDFSRSQIAVGQDLGPTQDAIAHHVKVVEGVEHTPLGGLYVELLDLAFVEGLAWLGNLDREGAGASLVGDGQTSLVIEGHSYPGAILPLVYLVDEVHFEARRYVESRGGILNRLFQWRQLALAKGVRQRKR